MGTNTLGFLSRFSLLMILQGPQGMVVDWLSGTKKNPPVRVDYMVHINQQFIYLYKIVL
jgi:hypothetical protein